MLFRNVKVNFLLAVAAAFLLVSCAGDKQRTGQEQAADRVASVPEQAVSPDANPVFQDEALNTAYDHYIRLKEALVADKVEEAGKAAGALQNALAQVPDAGQTASDAQAVATASDLQGQREAFSALSNSMTEVIRSAALKSGELYLAFCPMANNDQGAYWLASEQEIRNPYFGEKMLKCGEVKETMN